MAAGLSHADAAPAAQHAERAARDRDGQLLRYPTVGRSPTGVTTTCGRGSASICHGCATQQISTHWLRHTTLTWVERNFGYAVARAYAGHTDGGSGSGSTATYVRATLHEVAVALAGLTSEDHPLAVEA